MIAPYVVEPGDTVQARLETPEGIVPLEFVVTGVVDGVVSGAPLLGDLDPADGWTFEIFRKGDPGLPDTLSDLAAWTYTDRADPVRIVGPLAGNWQTADGRPIDPGDVVAWAPWVDPEPDPNPAP